MTSEMPSLDLERIALVVVDMHVVSTAEIADLLRLSDGARQGP